MGLFFRRNQAKRERDDVEAARPIEFRRHARVNLPAVADRYEAQFEGRTWRVLNTSDGGVAIEIDDRRAPVRGLMRVTRNGAALREGIAMRAWGRDGVVGYKLTSQLPLVSAAADDESERDQRAARMRRRINHQLAPRRPPPSDRREIVWDANDAAAMRARLGL